MNAQSSEADWRSGVEGFKMWEEEASEWSRTGIYATFTVESVDETVEWYHRMFGWKVGKDAFDENGNSTFGAVIYGYHAINFAQGEDKQHYTYRDIMIMIDVLDVDALHESVLGKGGKPLNKPKNES